MSSPDGSTLAFRLRDALIAITPDRPQAIDSLRELYADDIVFRDPIQEVRGIQDFIAMNRRLVGRMRVLQWTVTSAKGDDNEAFLEWTMRGTTKLGLKVKVEGITRARARQGRIVDHRDYWDLGELVASAVPGGQRILHTVLSPLS